MPVIWLIVTVFATLINPWGWRIYRSVRTGSAEQMQLNVNEWSGVPITWSAASGALSLRETHGTIHLLLAIAAVAALLAFWQRQVGRQPCC